MREEVTRMAGKVVVSDNNIRESKFNYNQYIKKIRSKVLSD